MSTNEFEIPDIIANEANLRGADAKALTSQLLYSPMLINVPVGNQNEKVQFIPGQRIDGLVGPQPNKVTVMVIGKMPGKVEHQTGKLMQGPSGVFFLELLEQLQIKYSDWYFTNVVRFAPPTKKSTLPVKWVKSCRHLLEEEISHIQPEYLLLTGGDAIKALFGRSATIKKYQGATDLEYKGIPTVVAPLPAAILSAPQLKNDLEQALKYLKGRINGAIKAPQPTNYEVVNTEERLKTIVDALINDKYMRFAVDCEWGAKSGSSYERGGKLRTIQFSQKPYNGFCVELRKKGLEPAFEPNIEAAFAQLRRLFCRKGVKLGGHNIPADIKWLEKEACIECIPQFFDGIDTMQAYHLAHPNESSFQLERVATRYTDLGRYDQVIDNWFAANVKKENATLYKDMYGYAEIPGDVLYPYSMKDVDAVMRIWDTLEQELQQIPVENPYVMPGVFHPAEINNLYDFYRYIEHPAIFPRYDMECNGLPADKDRFVKLVELFAKKTEEIITKLQTLLKWPKFNPNSYKQVVELLFATPPYEKRIRPEDAITLGLVPIKTTDKPPKSWAAASLSDKTQGKTKPSTDIESLQVLIEQAKETNTSVIPALKTLLQFKYINQINQNFLRSPELNVWTGNYEWIGGLLSCIDPDGKIRSTILALTDTGRYSSKSPNLQNLPKKRESALRKIFSIDEKKLENIEGWSGLTVQQLKDQKLINSEYHTIRSCFKAPPGWVLIESDYKQAELAVLAYISGDEAMMAVIDDPDRDLHSEMTVDAFQLTCDYKEVKKLHPDLRIGAKAANFRIPYGGGGEALARQVKAEAGVELSIDAANRIKNTFLHEKFAKTGLFFDSCHQSMEEKGFVVSAFGRRRYFNPTNDRGILAANKREAGNMPIQGTVADMLNIALYNIWCYKHTYNMNFLISLAIHDAVFLLVPWFEIQAVKDSIIPICMRDGANVPTIRLAVDTDITIMKRWGEPIDDTKEAIELAEKEAEEVGLVEHYNKYGKIHL